jgi:1-acyl-sn-glycerol-3-phosphate acyltransferase
MHDKEMNTKFAPFFRAEIENIHVIWSFPFYCTYLIRLAMGWITICTLAIGTALISAGQDVRNMDPWRKFAIKKLSQYCCRTIIFLGGFYRIDYDYDEKVDYSKYLGPDWKREFDGAFVFVGNHVGFLDVMAVVYWMYPTLIARSTVRSNYFFKQIGDAANCLYVQRVGKGSKESKAKAFEDIKEHIRLNETGKMKQPFCLFPEGATTNGQFITQFKMGAFASLPDIQPFTLKYEAKY